MDNQFSRTEMLIGKNAMDNLSKSRVAVFGIGGVGGYAVEALVRTGIGTIDLIDSDKVSASNINRQIIATRKTIGQYKVDVAKERCLEINPDVIVNTHNVFFAVENENQFDFSQYDYVVDAIDTVSGKIALVMNSQKAGVPIISSMGAGNKMNPSMFEIADIYKTSVCPLAKVMRHELKKRGVKKLKVVYSKEEPIVSADCISNEMVNSENSSQSNGNARKAPGSNAFVPSVVGLIIASEVIKDLIGYNK